MKRAFEMEYKHPAGDKSFIEMKPYSSKYQDEYKKIYNECYHEMREALGIEPYDFIQDDSFFNEGMDAVYILEEGNEIIGCVTLNGDEIDDLIVNCKYQGRGYGKKILLWALENICSDRVILHVAEWNERAVYLYKKIGFEIVKTINIDSDNSTGGRI